MEPKKLIMASVATTSAPLRAIRAPMPLSRAYSVRPKRMVVIPQMMYPQLTKSRRLPIRSDQVPKTKVETVVTRADTITIQVTIFTSPLILA